MYNFKYTWIFCCCFIKLFTRGATNSLMTQFRVLNVLTLNRLGSPKPTPKAKLELAGNAHILMEINQLRLSVPSRCLSSHIPSLCA